MAKLNVNGKVQEFQAEPEMWRSPHRLPARPARMAGMTSLQRRLRGCMAGVRAKPFAPGALEWIEPELFLAHRSRGMRLETPAMRP